ncbi:TAFII28 domain-containing protein [Chloropicon primus]|uniref:TAFII28 domain-containing protein n=1 Tax=Chloropicon primus TaxID=1764295 RepID=A0A5B8MET8_9CHLO|nr:TAFII28 domain-containing protein [Chloropicon primus]UPQ98356.1 TAFII28 domain-containing protein [Chloropicon primus]|mmetsp:Transcript_4207/g.12264  ORF Transcript_4207/g.12264 Transcript_4207/m.12264 type:complete len:149 (+) Transcript_4207:384-830(+)|eukprot:QDZ19148.1 TAFII28 domain-containing protein [Chloropicon primus]
MAGPPPAAAAGDKNSRRAGRGGGAAGRSRPASSYSVWDLDNLDTEGLRQLQGEQLERFEAYRRSAIPKATMKKLLLAVTGQTPDVNTTIVACGLAKLLVGEIVEAARKVAEERGAGDAPLTVGDLRRAYTLTLEETQLPLAKKRPRLM